MEPYQQNSADIITTVYIEIIQFSVKAISNFNEANHFLAVRRMYMYS